MINMFETNHCKILYLSSMDIKFVSELDKLLLKPKKIVIIPHRNPDGDALGSSLALKHYLSKKVIKPQ